MTTLPEHPVILFAHAAYQMRQRFEAHDTGLHAIEALSRQELQARAGEADVIVVSGLWDNAILEAAPRLRFVQSISAGVDQYDQAAFRRTGVRLASAQGVNANAVSDHAMALVLSLARLLPQARDNQAKRHWRGMIGNIPEREDELGGKTMLVLGLAVRSPLVWRLRMQRTIEVTILPAAADTLVAELQGLEPACCTDLVCGAVERADVAGLPLI